MSTAAFPTLSSGFQSFPQESIDSTIRSEMEAGYTQTRPRFTRTRRTFGPVQMILNKDDRDTLVAFDAQVGGHVKFTVAHPDTGETLTVRFPANGRVKTAPMLNTPANARKYTAEFSFEEV